MSELVSVIIPVYNKEKYVEACILGVRAQTYANLEILLVDDGSQDASGEICDRLAKEDDRILVIHKENGGLSDARNAGIDKAKGEYLFFVDADDVIEPEAIQELYSAVKRTKADIAISNFLWQTPEGEVLGDSGIIKNDIWGKRQLFEALTGENSFYFVVAWNKLYHRSLWENFRFKKGKIHEDEFAVHHIFGRCEKAVLVEKCLYRYIRREDSITSTNTQIKRLDVLEAICDRFDYVHENGPEDCLQSAARQLWEHYRHFYFAENPDAEGKRRQKEIKELFHGQYPKLMRIKPIKVKNLLKYTLFRYWGYMKRV